MLGHGSLLERQIRHYRWLMNVYRSPPRGSTAHMMINIHQAAPPLPAGAPSVSTGTYRPWHQHRIHLHAALSTHTHPNLCAAAKVKVSSSRAMRRSGGRCEACWESRKPRHVFRPPAGKYTLNATESAGDGRRARNTRSLQAGFAFEVRRGCKRFFSVITRGL